MTYEYAVWINIFYKYATVLDDVNECWSVRLVSFTAIVICHNYYTWDVNRDTALNSDIPIGTIVLTWVDMRYYEGHA